MKKINHPVLLFVKGKLQVLLSQLCLLQLSYLYDAVLPSFALTNAICLFHCRFVSQSIQGFFGSVTRAEAEANANAKTASEREKQKAVEMNRAEVRAQLIDQRGQKRNSNGELMSNRDRVFSDVRAMLMEEDSDYEAPSIATASLTGNQRKHSWNILTRFWFLISLLQLPDWAWR